MPIYNNVLAGSGQAAAGDLGAPIDQSLRFTSSGSSQKLQSSSSLATDHTEATCSFWFKFSNVSQTALAGLVSHAGGVNVVTSFDGRTTRNRLFNGGAHTTGFYEDPTAWYHIVHIYGRKAAPANTVSLETFINGKLVLDTTINSVSGQSDNFRIGEVPGHGTGFQGYIAEFNYLDGTAIGLTADGNPDEFGRYNEDGVWVPKKVTGLTSTQYGAKGFRLTFDSSQTNANIGEDSAPIGASGHTARNDFTATGFDTADLASYSPFVYGDNSTSYNSSITERTFLNSSFTADKGFDGDDSTNTSSGTGATGGNWIYFKPKTAIPISSSLVIRTAQCADIRINGTTTGQSQTGSSAADVTISSPPSSLTEVAIQGTASSTARFYSIDIDGTTLVDNTDNDVDYFDTPTNNYATLNPLNVFDANVTYSKANLRANYGTVNNSVVFVDMPMADGKYYWELTLKDQVEGWAGVITEDYVKRQLSAFADNSDSWAYELSGSTNNSKRHIGNNTSSHGSLVANDTIGFLLDIASGTLKIEINGTTQSNSEFTNIPTSKRLLVAFNIGGGSGNVNMDWNFGQMPFVHSQTGYSDVATNSLPEPTIKNGRDYFAAATYPGNGGSTQTISLDFKPDLIWIKAKDAASSHCLYDTIRGATAMLNPDDTQLERADGNVAPVSGVSGGFTVGALNTVAGSTNINNINYVAWCWKAGGAPTTDNSNGVVNGVGAAQTAGSVKVDGSDGSFAQGSIAVKKMSVNTTAGFSIATYTGTGSAGTIPHGLGAAPEWALLKRTDGTSAWSVYHKSMGNQNKMQLNENLKMSDFGTGTDIWNGISPTNQVFSIGVAGDVNTLNEQFIAYMWAPVEGFSKFGSYEGNGNPDGTFVYLGFRPSLIIFKNVDALGSWVMYDTARNTDNPVDTRLTANTNLDEGTSASMLVDFLSNGFKHRNNDQDLNSNDTFIYMAFAENPFGGENAPPATAR